MFESRIFDFKFLSKDSDNSSKKKKTTLKLIKPFQRGAWSSYEIRSPSSEPLCEL